MCIEQQANKLNINYTILSKKFADIANFYYLCGGNLSAALLQRAERIILTLNNRNYMKKIFTFLLMTLSMSLSFTSVYAQDTETYDQEYVAQDLLVTVNGESSTTFQGSADYINFDFTIFAVGYGTHEIEGFIGQMKAKGTAVFSYSEEYKSDLLVASLNVPQMGWKVKVTMYTLYIEPTDTIVCENMEKKISTRGWSPTLTLSGQHEEYGKVSFTIQGCNGAYNKYPTISGKVGTINVMGNGSWSNKGNKDVLEAILATEDTTQVFHVWAYTKAEVQQEPIQVEVTNATFTASEEESDEEGSLVINGTSTDGKVVALVLLNFDEIGFGTYPTNSLTGTINGIEVANLQTDAYLSEDEMEVALETRVEDAEGNIYNVVVYGESPNKQKNIQVVATNLKAEVAYGTNLKLTATTEEGVAIELLLYEGANRGYGEYGYDGNYSDVETAIYGKITLTLSKEVTAKYYPLGDIDVFEGTFTGSDNNIYQLKLSSAALPSGIEDVTTTNVIEKIIDNGQLIILKNGVKYNATGGIVK